MKKIFSILLLVLLFAGCAATPFESDTTSGVNITITLGDNAKVNDITITTSSDNAQESSTKADQDATQDTSVDVDATATP